MRLFSFMALYQELLGGEPACRLLLTIAQTSEGLRFATTEDQNKLCMLFSDYARQPLRCLTT